MAFIYNIGKKEEAELAGNKAEEKVEPVKEEEVAPVGTSKMSDKEIINKIRMLIFLNESGKITKEQYKERVAKLFE